VADGCASAAALGQIGGLKDALARLRKFGGRCVLGLQSIAQVRGTYGDTEAQTIVENCGNTLILRCSASERGGTAEFASRLIGKREIIRRQVSQNRPAGFGGAAKRTETTSDHHVTEDAVMASEIEQRPDLARFLKLASRPDWRHVTVYSRRRDVSSGPPAIEARSSRLGIEPIKHCRQAALHLRGALFYYACHSVTARLRSTRSR
jgi:Type IV secretion-system coupling protein DNA-binding domain